MTWLPGRLRGERDIPMWIAMAFALVLSGLAAAAIVGMTAGDPVVAALLNALA